MTKRTFSDAARLAVLLSGLVLILWIQGLFTVFDGGFAFGPSETCQAGIDHLSVFAYCDR